MRLTTLLLLNVTLAQSFALIAMYVQVRDMKSAYDELAGPLDREHWNVRAPQLFDSISDRDQPFTPAVTPLHLYPPEAVK